MLLSLSARDQLRRRSLPHRLRLLFIGEAPPASGRFFYCCNSGLYRAIRDAFHLVQPSHTDADFLATFQASGCYLVDTCPYPVDRLDAKSRTAACLASEPLLTRAIRELRPPVIMTTVRSIRPVVERAALHSRWCGRLLDLPYPGRWAAHRKSFIAQLVPELAALPLGTGASAECKL